MINRFIAALPLALLAAAPSTAQAHAFLRTATPAVGSTLRVAPAAVRIDFTEGVEAAFSHITVQDAHGTRVDQGAVHLDGDDTHLAVALKPLAPGAYTVMWQATATDTHHTEGRFTFTIAP